MNHADDDFSAKQENNILDIVHSNLDAYYDTPLKTKISMLVQDTLHYTPIIKGIDITTLAKDVESCITKITHLEAEIVTSKTELWFLSEQLKRLQDESNGTVLGKLVVLKE